MLISNPAREARWSLADATREERVFASSLLLVAAYLAVRLVVGDLVAVAFVASIALIPAVFVVFHRGRRAVRALLCTALGLAGAAAGLAVHVPAVVFGSMRAEDLAGVGLAMASIVLLGMALRITLRGRGWRARLLAVPVCVVILQWFVVPFMQAGVITNVPRPEITAPETLGLPGAREVSFPARDGVRLSAWFAPGHNGGAVVLAHGSHGSRDDTTGHLRALAQAGYSVLAFDARGHGDSAGQTNALGWQGDDDVAGAVAFLRHQPGIDPGRIAMLGLSMGAEEALRAAAEGIPLAAVVADGAGASTAGDAGLTSHAAIPGSVRWLSMRVTELVAGEREPSPLKDMVHRVDAPVLLIASGAADELAFNRAYRRRIGRRASLWYLPDVTHTQGLERHPASYSRRVTRFLRAALTSR